VYDDIVRLFFLPVDGESSILSEELRQKSDQFHPLRDTRLVDLKGSVGLILDKVSGMRVTIPIDLSKRTFIPLPHFFNSRRPTPLLNPPSVIFPLNPSLVIFPSYFHNNFPQVAYDVRSLLKGLFSFTVYHSSSVTFVPLALSFFIRL
jgi:hypothetical protein